MARKPRMEYAGAVYHVMNRGDRGGKVFKDRLDYELFVHTTAEVCERTGWRIHACIKQQYPFFRQAGELRCHARRLRGVRELSASHIIITHH